MTNKKIFIRIILVCLVLFVYGCSTKEDTIEQNRIVMTSINGVEMFSIKELPKVSAISVSSQEEKIILKEDQLKVTLLTGSRFIYQHGRIVDSLSAAPLEQGGSIFLPSSFINDYLRSSIEVGLSLYHGAKYLPSEVASALKKPTNEHNMKVLKAIELPRSMNITTPKIDENRIIQTQPLSQMPKVLIEDLKRQGYENADKYTYGEYEVISELQTLEEAGLTSIERSYPELSKVDISDWTVKDYHKWQSDYMKEQQSAMYSDEEKRIMQKKGILIDDMFYLHKEFNGTVLEQPDEVLKKTLEDYYNMVLQRYLQQ